MKNMKNKVQNLTLTALMAAILCVVGPVVIPIGMVPMSFTNMVIYLTIILLDKKRATISVAIYLLIGFIGLPVFAGFSGGAGKIFGPTGGYLLGYLVLSWVAGIILERFTFIDQKILKHLIALMIGTICLYLVGTLWLMFQSKLNFVTALSVGVLPFVIIDMIKMAVAVMLSDSIKRRMPDML